MNAYTGQEEIWRKAFNAFGVDDASFVGWSNGPAYLTWSRGQSMHGVGSPVSKGFMRQQWQLQRLILGRLRSLGITPVLPTFQGNLPPKMKTLFPQANMSIRRSFTGATTCWLDGRDPLFKEIQAAYMKLLISDFGTDHWYETDGSFDQGNPPWLSESMVQARAHSSAVYNSMSQIDSEAVWLYQGWIWRQWGDAKADYIRGWVSGVPKGKVRFLLHCLT